MIFVPKCRPFNVVLEKGHGTGKKGKALEKRGMAQCQAKIGQGNTTLSEPLKTGFL